MSLLRCAVVAACWSLIPTLLVSEAAAQGKVTLAAKDKTVHGIAVLIDGKLFADLAAFASRAYQLMNEPTGRPVDVQQLIIRAAELRRRLKARN